jgi:hypothetical protein
VCRVPSSLLRAAAGIASDTSQRGLRRTGLRRTPSSEVCVGHLPARFASDRFASDISQRGLRRTSPSEVCVGQFTARFASDRFASEITARFASDRFASDESQRGLRRTPHQRGVRAAVLVGHLTARRPCRTGEPLGHSRLVLTRAPARDDASGRERANRPLRADATAERVPCERQEATHIHSLAAGEPVGAARRIPPRAAAEGESGTWQGTLSHGTWQHDPAVGQRGRRRRDGIPRPSARGRALILRKTSSSY